MPIALASVSLVDGTIFAANAVFRRLFKIPDDKVDSVKFLSFYPPDELELVRKWYSDMRNQPSQLVEIARTYLDYEGKPFHGFVYAWSTVGPEGHVDRLIGAFFDTKISNKSQFVSWASRRSERAARAQLARETANELNNGITQLTATLENHLGPIDSMPQAVQSAINRAIGISRRLLILGWSDDADVSNPQAGTGIKSEIVEASDLETILNAGPMRILVVEDNAELREQIVESLRAYGHLAAGAADGKSALLLLDELDANRALVDMRLEFESGRDVAEQLRKRRPGISVVYMTGYASVSAIESSQTSDPIIMKPFKVVDVIDMLKLAGTGGRTMTDTGASQ